MLNTLLLLLMIVQSVVVTSLFVGYDWHSVFMFNAVYYTILVPYCLVLTVCLYETWSWILLY